MHILELTDEILIEDFNILPNDAINQMKQSIKHLNL